MPYCPMEREKEKCYATFEQDTRLKIFVARVENHDYEYALHKFLLIFFADALLLVNSFFK